MKLDLIRLNKDNSTSFKTWLTKRKEIITRVSNNNSLQAGNNLVASRQAGRHSPSLRGRQQHPSGQSSPFPQGRRWSKHLPGRLRLRCSPSLRGRQQFLTPGHCSPSSQGRKQFFPGNCSPSYKGRKQFSPGNCSTSLPGKQAVPPRQLLTFPLGKEAVLPRQLLTFLTGKEAILPWQTAHLPPGEGSGSS